MHRMIRFAFLILVWSLAGGTVGYALPPPELAKMIADFNADSKGPYAAIRWFCPDGSVIPADARCGAPGGIQHALLRPSVQRLAEKKGGYWGPILGGTRSQALSEAVPAFMPLRVKLHG